MNEAANQYETITFNMMEESDTGRIMKHKFANDGEVVAVNVSVDASGFRLIHYTVKVKKQN